MKKTLLFLSLLLGLFLCGISLVSCDDDDIPVEKQKEAAAQLVGTWTVKSSALNVLGLCYGDEIVFNSDGTVTSGNETGIYTYNPSTGEFSLTIGETVITGELDFNGNILSLSYMVNNQEYEMSLMKGSADEVLPTLLDNSNHYVDLGLPSGTLWATMNIGASSPEEYGDYYAWGETWPKELYNYKTYRYCGESRNTINKYNTSRTFGTVDGKVELHWTDDAACQIWGPCWRMPSWSQYKELHTYCTWMWRSVKGIEGYVVTGQNGNSIFFPAAGCKEHTSLYVTNKSGLYWMREVDVGNANNALNYFFNGSARGLANSYDRDYGLPVRPVRASIEETEESCVDLGLPSGTLWATCNVGAEKPHQCGEYFAWGEIFPAPTTWSTYKYCNGSNTTMTKYCNNSSYGTVDTKTELELADDAAYVNWGPVWRMPSLTQFEELINSNYTTSEWIKQNDMEGCKITSKTNGKSIFLPLTFARYGRGYAFFSEGLYWSRTLDTKSPYSARTLDFYTPSSTGYINDTDWIDTYWMERAYQLNIRPVCTSLWKEDGIHDELPGEDAENTDDDVTPTDDSSDTHEYVDLGLGSGTLWATCNVGASSPEKYGNYYAWGETTTKETYDWTTYKWTSGSSSTPTKYTGSASADLVTSDDAAYINWGSNWRMPTSSQFSELINSCTWKWTSLNGINGYQVTGPNENTIFLPAAGWREDGSLSSAGSYGGYWSRTLFAGDPLYACRLDFKSSYVDKGYYYGRYFGFSVRPVRLSE